MTFGPSDVYSFYLINMKNVCFLTDCWPKQAEYSDVRWNILQYHTAALELSYFTKNYPTYEKKMRKGPKTTQQENSALCIILM